MKTKKIFDAIRKISYISYNAVDCIDYDARQISKRYTKNFIKIIEKLLNDIKKEVNNNGNN